MSKGGFGKINSSLDFLSKKQFLVGGYISKQDCRFAALSLRALISTSRQQGGFTTSSLILA